MALEEDRDFLTSKLYLVRGGVARGLEETGKEALEEGPREEKCKGKVS